MEMAWKQVTECSAKSRRKAVTGQNLNTNNSPSNLKACYNFTVDLLYYKHIEARKNLEDEDLGLGKYLVSRKDL